jgi:hypothetical protein
MPAFANSMAHLFNVKDAKRSLLGYISILQSASGKNVFSGEEQELLLNAIEESQQLLHATFGVHSDDDYKSQLDLLHNICDHLVAFYSVEMAIQARLNSTIPPLVTHKSLFRII